MIRRRNDAATAFARSFQAVIAAIYIRHWE